MSDSLWLHGLQYIRLPVHHHLPELAQTHVHRISDVIQQSHPLTSPSPPASNPFCIRVFSKESVFQTRSPTVSIVSPSICHEVMGLGAMLLVFWMLSFKPTFTTLLFHFHQEVLQFIFAFCHKGGILFISEVIDISPGNLASQLVLHPAWYFTWCALHIS